MKQLFLMIAAFFVTHTAFAENGDAFTAKTEEGVEVTYVVIDESKKRCQVGDGTQTAIERTTSGKVTIPEEVNGYEVYCFGQLAFAYCSELEEIILPSTLYEIQNGAFWDCCKIETIRIPASMVSLSEGAFSGNDSMKEFMVDEDCSYYRSVDGMLCNKSGTTLYDFPAAREGEFVIPSEIKTIYINSFSHTHLSKLTIPSTIENIKSTLTTYGVARGSETLETVVWETAASLPTEAFEGCRKLTSITITEGVSSIGYGAFQSTGITEMELPSSVKNIGSYAFDGCKKLKHISIPTSVQKIYSKTFTDCFALEDITIQFTTSEMFMGEMAENAFSAYNYEKTILNVPTGTKNFFNTTAGWMKFQNVVEYGEAVVPDVPIKDVPRRAVIEESTSTSCMYCGYGVVFMQQAREEFGEQFIGIAIHPSDVMKHNGYAQLSFSGQPTLHIDRTETIYQPPFDLSIVRSALKKKATVDVTVSGTYNRNKTKVKVTSNTELLMNAPGFSVAYALVADNVKGESNKWYQKNAFSGSTHPDYQWFGERSNPITDMVYDDVLIGSSYNSKGENLADPFEGETKAGLIKTNTYTIDLPSEGELAEAIDKDQVFVVAIVTNPDGTVANAAKAKVTISTEEPVIPGDVNGDEKVNGTDIQAVINVIVDEDYVEEADINNDNKVNGTDIQEIINIIVEEE